MRFPEKEIFKFSLIDYFVATMSGGKKTLNTGNFRMLGKWLNQLTKSLFPLSESFIIIILNRARIVKEGNRESWCV